MPPLKRPLTSLHGVGSERAAQLARLGLVTVGDLLLHRPRRHEDRRHFLRIADLEVGKPSTTRGTVVASGVKRFRGGRQSVFELVIDDGSARLHCRWWNLPFMEKYFAVGDEVFVYGKPVSLKPRTIDHPETEVIEPGEETSIHLNRIAPVYPLTEGLPQRWMRSLMWRVLEQFESQIVELHPQAPVPDLPTRQNAVHMIHFPEEMSDVDVARQRLALDEFIDLQIEIQRRRRLLQARTAGLPCRGDNRLMKPFLSQLGFTLTDAQIGVLRELRHDLGAPHPMRRLLQGDVGSGKTVVAACCALMTLESGFNVAFMAPTEILAEQHSLTLGAWFKPLGIAVELRTGSRKSVTGKPTMPTVYIGTHALLSEGFDLPKLGLVIVDEQHKFGVAQRETLVRKGAYPHLLVMTATPIPRTLGLTLYGDLDVSVIHQMPTGRGNIRTHLRTTSAAEKVWKFVKEQLEQGRQAYIVYSRVEDSDTRAGLKAVTEEYEVLQKKFAPFKVGLLHGRVKSQDKETVMAGFRANTIHVLVATSVIEVGVNVPNATVMVIENADQFGLAQLHQLRGRIGRGAHDSHCILMAAAKTDEAKARLKIMEETNDGFRIAEEDMKLRGPGELLGQNQSGRPQFIFGDLQYDLGLIERARGLAKQILDKGKPVAARL